MSSSFSDTENINPFEDDSRQRTISSRTISSRTIIRPRTCRKKSKKLKMIYYLLKSNKNLSKLLLRHL